MAMAADGWGDAPGVLDADRDAVCLDAGKQEAGGNDGGECKGPCVPILAHGLFDVIGRAAAITAVVILLFIYLCQRALDKGRGGAEKGRHPHPEHGAGTTERNGRRHAGDVADADTPRQRHGQRLERGNTRCGLLPGEHQPDHFCKAADLHESGADREVQTGAEAQINERAAPDDAIEEVDDFTHAIVPSVPRWRLHAAVCAGLSAAKTVPESMQCTSVARCPVWRIAVQNHRSR